MGPGDWAVEVTRPGRRANRPTVHQASGPGQSQRQIEQTTKVARVQRRG